LHCGRRQIVELRKSCDLVVCVRARACVFFLNTISRLFCLSICVRNSRPFTQQIWFHKNLVVFCGDFSYPAQVVRSAMKVMEEFYAAEQKSVAEVFAVWKAVEFGKNIKVQNIILEGNVLKIVHAFRNGEQS